MDRSNLTALTGTLVTKVLFDGRRTTGVEVIRDGKVEHFLADSEVVLSLDAIQTPKVPAPMFLMFSKSRYHRHMTAHLASAPRRWRVPVLRAGSHPDPVPAPGVIPHRCDRQHAAIPTSIPPIMPIMPWRAL